MQEEGSLQDVTKINIDYPEVKRPRLRIGVGACRLRIGPGDQEALVSGTYSDPTGSMPLKIVEEGDTIRLSQRQRWSEILGWLSGVPEFDLTLGTSRPYQLIVEAGASEHKLDLGGLPLTRLEVRHGAGKMDIDFSSPNPEPMSMLHLGSGAGSINILNLANANFDEMILEGGAASYRVHFGGQLQRDGHVRISTGVSSVELKIPSSTAAKLYSESVIGSLHVDKSFTKTKGAYWTEAAMAEESPVLTVRLSVALGSVELRRAD
ncbi:MAG: hypothetical protein PVH65_08255 [Chloroflexota bacterium]|jgi:hypothetical protein